MAKSPIRVCQTCGGNGVVTRKTTRREGKKTVEITESVKCTAGCNNGVFDTRNV